MSDGSETGINKRDSTHRRHLHEAFRMPGVNTTVCIAEDRPTCEPCLRLLLLSLKQYSPDTTVCLFYPHADSNFLQWLTGFPRVQLQQSMLRKGYGWNVKPQAMLQLLDAGFDEVIWIDSDVLVTQDIVPLFASINTATVVATEHPLGKERQDGHAVRARLWRLPIGRTLPAAVNSGVVRVTADHRILLERWWTLLQSDEYQRCQRSDWRHRPIHMLGDQDVLTALLTSQEFSRVPLRILERGKHIIQFDGIWGYTVQERLRNLVGDGPVFIHSIASKPWAQQWSRPTNAKDYLKTLYMDLSPYTQWSRRFAAGLGSDTDWMASHYRSGAVLRVLGLGHPALTGLPLALVADVARGVIAARDALRRRSGPSTMDLERRGEPSRGRPTST